MDSDNWVEALFGPIIAIGLVIAAIVYFVLAIVGAVIAAIVLFFGARVALFLTRDFVVMGWPDTGQTEKRVAIIAWLTIVPLIWVFVVYEFAGLIFHEHWFLSLLSCLVFGGCYFWHYINAKFQHPTWVSFMAQEDGMVADLRLAFLERRFKLKLWWATFGRSRNTKQTKATSIQNERTLELEELAYAKSAFATHSQEE
jgi:hypothetical protein